jgi:glycosyltransferase involved in cell wall biosynthesis
VTGPAASRALRVLHIEYGINFGGSAISLAELVRGLRAATPVESTVLSFQARGLNEDAYPDAQVIRKPRAVSYQTRRDFDDALARWRVPPGARRLALKAYGLLFFAYEQYLTAYIARLVRRRRIDIVHANNFWEPSAIRGALRGGAKCVLHIRGYPTTERGSVRERFGAAVDDVITRYIAISEAVADATRAFGATPAKVVTIPNPVSVATYQDAAARRDATRARHGLAPHHVAVGVFGRVTAWKGQVEFVEAVRTIAADCPDLRVLIVGDESDSADTNYRDRLHALVASPELAGRVILAGFQSDVAAYYAACDVVVHCSRSREPFGRVVIEGMAAGKPLVAMAEGGPLDILTDGVDGILVPPRDDARLAAAVRALHDDAALRARMGAAALATVHARFSSEAIARRVHEEFRASLA